MSLYDDERGCGGGRRASNKTRRLWLFMMFVSCLVRSLTKTAPIFRILQVHSMITVEILNPNDPLNPGLVNIHLTSMSFNTRL
jgi:multisubunit Na+/H+ antiporter MnhE subunit